jgi:NAD(P)-dependent dehydrogenase (short-subunit alcohol dehydrogenase family)
MAEPSSFGGKVAVVTGAAQGVGEATARLMAARGAAGLALIDRQPERLAAVAADLTVQGCPAEPIVADLADVQACLAAVDRAASRFGALHCLVNAAGATDRGTIDDTTPELFDRIMAVDARAPFFLIQRSLPHMRKAGGGTIVNIISITVHGGAGYLAPYVAAKGALAAMTRNVAGSILRDRIRVNGLNLGWTLTDNERVIQMQAHDQPADWPEQAAATLPFGRLLTPEDAARAICFMASDESGLMTGALIDFDQQVVGFYPAARTSR